MRIRSLLPATLVLASIAAPALGQAPVEPPANALKAAKLAGLAGFVNVHCETLRTDGDRFKSVVKAMGVDPADLERDTLLLHAQSYLAVYEKDVPASCARADEMFGRTGKVVPGVFVPR
ncbi:hypothetical protein AO398_09760 [Methylobacterium sp. GXS13]|jgi:hypothetical protein|uniref:hypothetical protein n=1 Tax=Methylobacterium sp. GXS13 TaxID=1730094 RepID=UPI00071B1D7F|nr:hypothetical protein [Methylobacterium sp. GXS13]KST56849.1 hypothetical protein AO398_09760 [Methylobacterium sp. GXS13]